MQSDLARFVEGCQAIVARESDVAARVDAIAPLMQKLTQKADAFLEPAHLQSDPTHYRRNAIYFCPNETLSLFSIVWLPGQWTPVHDHGSWGVVGVVRGNLEERAYMCPTGEICSNDGIVLRRGGVVLLNPGAVTSFVPNPDHIHVTGVDAAAEPCVSLHLYGRNMNSFHIYDLAAGTRRLIDVPHHAVNQ
ncbi:MAG: cysteine dioxygenase [Alphaproteobacteria bacterium]|nr:cysteine dioxygenase [Alphaproteobacteria bacterium]